MKNQKIMTTKEKYYTDDHIMKEYGALSLKKKNDILYDALDFMQQYNGRSKFLCIAMAMGYDNYEGENNTYIKK
jgi:hypothetical protein